MKSRNTYEIKVDVVDDFDILPWMENQGDYDIPPQVMEEVVEIPNKKPP